MSINIVAKDLRKEFWTFDRMKAAPIYISANDGDARAEYDGDWIKVTSVGAADIAIASAGWYEGQASTQNPNDVLYALATCKVTVDNGHYNFFMEPHIGGYSEYQGLDTRDGAVHFARSRDNSVQTATDIDPQDWTVQRVFALRHRFAATKCNFYIDGAEQASHAANISSAPFQVMCCEPNAATREAFCLYPPGIYVRRAGAI